MPTRGTKSKSRPGHENYVTHKGSKFAVRNHHRVKPYGQKKHGGIAWMPLAMGANAGLGLINSLVSMIRHSKGAGYTRRGPVMKKGFTT